MSKMHTKLEFFTPGILHPVTTQTLPTDNQGDISMRIALIEVEGGLLSKKWFYPWHSISRVRITHFPAPPEPQHDGSEVMEAKVESTPVDPIIPARSEPDHRLGAVEQPEPEPVEIMHNEGNPNHGETVCVHGNNRPRTANVPGDPIDLEVELNPINDGPDASVFLGEPELVEPEEQVEIITQPGDEEALDRIFGPRHD